VPQAFRYWEFERTNLTVVVDAPLALDYLGCSGVSRKNDVRGIFEALRGIGCSFVVFPVTCSEMQRNLRSLLSNQEATRHGPTHEAIVKREVLEEYVQAVANDPEAALDHAGIKVKPLDLKQMPHLFKFFPYAWYDDFFSSILWVSDVAPREHDATCLALTVRLREGKHNSDLFKCGYVFVTRNPRFVQHSRSYCFRAFDCRHLFLSKTRPERLAMVKSGVVSNEVLSAGRKRLKTLDPSR
jgi:hypothetical protein